MQSSWLGREVLELVRLFALSSLVSLGYRLDGSTTPPFPSRADTRTEKRAPRLDLSREDRRNSFEVLSGKSYLRCHMTIL